MCQSSLVSCLISSHIKYLVPVARISVESLELEKNYKIRIGSINLKYVFLLHVCTISACILFVTR